MSFQQLEEEAARHRCLICGIICKDAPDLSHHRANRHARYTCGRCQFKCMTIKKFITHLKSDERCRKHFDGETLPSNSNAELSAYNTEILPQPAMSGNYYKLPHIVILNKSQLKQLGMFAMFKRLILVNMTKCHIMKAKPLHTTPSYLLNRYQN